MDDGSFELIDEISKTEGLYDEYITTYVAVNPITFHYNCKSKSSNYGKSETKPYLRSKCNLKPTDIVVMIHFKGWLTQFAVLNS